MAQLTRRELIRLFGAGAAVTQLPACGDNNPGGDAVFTAAQRALLEDFADVIIPPDDTPGGAALGAVAYIEGLLQAYYGVGAPRIYAGGPFSDRNPLPDGTFPPNDFVTFVELDRVSDAAWRMAIDDMRTLLLDGLDAAAKMNVADRAKLYDAQPDEFRSLIFDLVTQAAWAAPEYGGNPGGAGWELVHFEGDTLPRGFSQFDGTSYVERPEAPLSTANPGDDPEPLTDDVHQLLANVIQVLGGKMKA